MAISNSNKQLLERFTLTGEKKFYNFLITEAINKLILIQKGNYKEISPDIQYLDYYDKLIVLYRREGVNEYLEMAKLFRKAAHRIYRVMLKKQLTNYNFKFLNLITKCP